MGSGAQLDGHASPYDGPVYGPELPENFKFPEYNPIDFNKQKSGGSSLYSFKNYDPDAQPIDILDKGFYVPDAQPSPGSGSHSPAVQPGPVAGHYSADVLPENRNSQGNSPAQLSQLRKAAETLDFYFNQRKDLEDNGKGSSDPLLGAGRAANAPSPRLVAPVVMMQPGAVTNNVPVLAPPHGLPVSVPAQLPQPAPDPQPIPAPAQQPAPVSAPAPPPIQNPNPSSNTDDSSSVSAPPGAPDPDDSDSSSDSSSSSSGGANTPSAERDEWTYPRGKPPHPANARELGYDPKKHSPSSEKPGYHNLPAYAREKEFDDVDGGLEKELKYTHHKGGVSRNPLRMWMESDNVPGERPRGRSRTPRPLQKPKPKAFRHPEVHAPGNTKDRLFVSPRLRYEGKNEVEAALVEAKAPEVAVEVPVVGDEVHAADVQAAQVAPVVVAAPAVQAAVGQAAQVQVAAPAIVAAPEVVMAPVAQIVAALIAAPATPVANFQTAQVVDVQDAQVVAPPVVQEVAVSVEGPSVASVPQQPPAEVSAMAAALAIEAAAMAQSRAQSRAGSGAGTPGRQDAVPEVQVAAEPAAAAPLVQSVAKPPPLPARIQGHDIALPVAPQVENVAPQVQNVTPQVQHISPPAEVGVQGVALPVAPLQVQDGNVPVSVSEIKDAIAHVAAAPQAALPGAENTESYPQSQPAGLDGITRDDGCSAASERQSIPPDTQQELLESLKDIAIPLPNKMATNENRPLSGASGIQVDGGQLIQVLDGPDTPQSGHSQNTENTDGDAISQISELNDEIAAYNHLLMSPPSPAPRTQPPSPELLGLTASELGVSIPALGAPQVGPNSAVLEVTLAAPAGAVEAAPNLPFPPAIVPQPVSQILEVALDAPGGSVAAVPNIPPVIAPQVAQIVEVSLAGSTDSVGDMPYIPLATTPKEPPQALDGPQTPGVALGQNVPVVEPDAAQILFDAAAAPAPVPAAAPAPKSLGSRLLAALRPGRRARPVAPVVPAPAAPVPEMVSNQLPAVQPAAPQAVNQPPAVQPAAPQVKNQPPASEPTEPESRDPRLPYSPVGMLNNIQLPQARRPARSKSAPPHAHVLQPPVIQPVNPQGFGSSRQLPTPQSQEQQSPRQQAKKATVPDIGQQEGTQMIPLQVQANAQDGTPSHLLPALMSNVRTLQPTSNYFGTDRKSVV